MLFRITQKPVFFVIAILFNSNSCFAASNDSTYASLFQPTILSPPSTIRQSLSIETLLTPYSDAESRFLKFLDQAKTRCYIASYSLTNRNIVSELIRLHNCGVDVQVITDRTQASGRNEQAALAVLQSNNIPVFIGKSVDNALMHCKFAVIDDHLTEDGSWNFTISANREDNILNFVDSKQRAAQFLNYWFKIKSDMK